MKICISCILSWVLVKQNFICLDGLGQKRIPNFHHFLCQFWQNWPKKPITNRLNKNLYSMYWDIGETEFDLPCDGLGLAVVWRLIRRLNSVFIFKSFVLALSKYRDDLIWPCWNWASRIVCLSRWSWILKLFGESGMT